MERRDVVIVGGGLAGLTAAALLSRAGRAVALLEGGEFGGRAKTTEVGEFRLNLGPHALYATGAGTRLLEELGVEHSGSAPEIREAVALYEGQRHALPRSMPALVGTSLLSPLEKVEAGKVLVSISTVDLAPLQNTTVNEWLARHVRSEKVRMLVRTLVRVSTYAADHDRLSAGAAFAQVRLGAEGVRYLDDGWETLSDGLGCVAWNSGATLKHGAPVTEVSRENGGWTVRLASGAEYGAPSVVLAVPPDVAARIVRDQAQLNLARWSERLIPVRAASLDLALRRLPDPNTRFALGVDRPLYFSVHGPPARLAPEGAAVIHAARYLTEDDGTPEQIERELEAVMDTFQPGWREAVVHRRFLREMVVSYALPTAADGGLAGRPGPEVSGAPGLYVAGDWAGAEGMLADAAFASARYAAERILAGSTSHAVA